MLKTTVLAGREGGYVLWHMSIGTVAAESPTVENLGMARSSPTPDVYVHCQCPDCSFKAAGTYAAVEIARRAHRHPDSSLVAIDKARRAGVWAKHFESPPPLSLDTTHLPQPFPRLYILGATLAAVMVTAGGAFFSRWGVEYSPLNRWLWKWGHPAFMLLLVGGLVYMLLRYANDRRAANIRRFQIVAECNHHIRNALQVLTLTQDAHARQGAREVSLIGDSVHRIELTLAEVLPGVVEGPRTGTEKRGWSLRAPSHPSFPVFTK